MAATATARAQEVADELGVDLAEVTGTGKGDRATVDDVREHAAQLTIGRPADFGPEQIAVWEEIEAYLDGHGLWNPLFAPLLERYIRRLDRSKDARERAEEKPVVKGSTGQMKANPFFRVEHDADVEAHKYAEALLLTPEMLQRHLKGSGGEDDDDIGF
ncbi:MAG TPA: P27 family phage terminase small subunit [Solirubrobacterales bacterium]|nr:P27 family phage terminase small subunit [Solirubrobacterales bacterium]